MYSKCFLVYFIFFFFFFVFAFCCKSQLATYTLSTLYSSYTQHQTVAERKKRKMEPKEKIYVKVLHGSGTFFYISFDLIVIHLLFFFCFFFFFYYFWVFGCLRCMDDKCSAAFNSESFIFFHLPSLYF